MFLWNCAEFEKYQGLTSSPSDTLLQRGY